jgi:hypothetical protein
METAVLVGNSIKASHNPSLHVCVEIRRRSGQQSSVQAFTRLAFASRWMTICEEASYSLRVLTITSSSEDQLTKN